MNTTTKPRPVIAADVIYLAHDQFVCIECAGTSATYTGRTINGVRLSKIGSMDVRHWESYDMGALTCECGRLSASLDASGAVRFS